ncbi:hypothetical protein FHS96_004590 [Sphingomonas zeicaulis]|uniref:hypothetical protein n=1 Tax=Sphingomonas zeicaulis TaxID=1632740 RepID=UPI003D1A49D3
MTKRGDAGHALTGPYEKVLPGQYRVSFEVALRTRVTSEDDPVCVVLDVTTHNGAVTLAQRELRQSELDTQLGRFDLDFTLHALRELEYRVYATGAAALTISGEARVEHLGEAGAMPEIDVYKHSNDPVEIGHQVRAVLRLLRPYALKGVGKIRLGNLCDGGYVCVDDFAGLDTALSFGINDDITWDCAAADRGMTIHQFDHTVEDPAPTDGRMIFHKKMITPNESETTQNIAGLVRRLDKGLQRPNMMLKMDIEAHEWEVMHSTSAEDLSRFSQIVCELHYFQALDHPDWRRWMYDSLTKLHQHYAVVHVHANVYGGLSNISNVVFPNVLEVTFANRAIYEFEETDELFPTPLDTPCDAKQPDIFLGNFRF